MSPFFHDVVQAGDDIEMRGPIGGHFIWDKADGGPILLVGGGSGVVPLVSMLRHRARSRRRPAVLVYSARRFDEVIFRDELMCRADRRPELLFRADAHPRDHAGSACRSGRIDRSLVGEVLAFGGAGAKRSYICGATAFVEVASMFLLDAGLPFARVRTERYGGDPAANLTQTVVAPEV